MPAQAGSVLGQAIRFGFTGVLNTLVDMGLFATLVYAANFQPGRANIISYGTGVLCSFALNSAWTFRVGFGHGMTRRLIAFVAVNLTGLAVSTAIVSMAARAFEPLIAKLISLPITYAWNFILSRKLVFREASTSI